MSGKRSAQVEIRVPFHDVDSVRIVWHGHYAKYFELARCALLDSFGYGYDAMVESGYIWPIVEMQQKFVKPARFGQQIRAVATLEEWEHRLKIQYLISDAATGQALTRGTTVQVAVDMKSGEMQLESPPVVAQRLGTAK